MHYAVSYTHLDVYKRQVEYSRPIVFGEDRLRERGSLPVSYTHLDVYKRQVTVPSKRYF